MFYNPRFYIIWSLPIIMKSKLSKQEAEQKIKEIFSNNPSPKEIKKAKRLAMNKKIRLGNLKKKFCKKCYALFDIGNSEIRIKKGMKVIQCKSCGQISRYKRVFFTRRILFN